MSLFILPPNARSDGSMRPRVVASPRPPWRVFVAESDRAVQKRWVEAVAADARFELAGVACEGVEALNRIERLAPDVVIMAMHMPRLLGREVIEALGGAVAFALIFSASPRFAGVRSLHANALDHVDFPADGARVARAFDRAHTDCTRRCAQSRAARLSHDCAELTVKTLDGRWHTLGTDEILRITAQRRHARIETRLGVYLVRKPLRELSSRLGSHFAWRSRSELVNTGSRVVAAAHDGDESAPDIAALPAARSV